ESALRSSEAPLHPVEQVPVRLQRRLRGGDEVVLPRRRWGSERVGRGGRMLDVERRMEPEVRGGRLLVRVAVATDEALELRLRDRGLRRLDCIEDGEGFEAVATSPRLGARTGLGRELAVERSVERGGEVVPQRHVLGLLRRVLRAARRSGGACERDPGVAILAGVEPELRLRQLAGPPAGVERVLEDVPALPRLVDAVAKLHLAPSIRTDPARGI